jgi:hypothetical protein
VPRRREKEGLGRVGPAPACRLEGYHQPHVHPGLNRQLDYRGYVTETHRWHSLQHSPIEDRDAGGI